MKNIFMLSLSISVFLFAETTGDKFEKAQNIVNINSNNDTAVALPVTSKTGKISIKDATIKAINSYRTSFQICSKPMKKLIWNPYYYNIAKEHSIDMAINQIVTHDGSGGKNDLTATNLNIKRGSKFYERVNQKVGSKDLISGELVVATKSVFYKTPREIIQYWMNKPKSCAVIMNSKFTDVALSKVVSNQNGKAYWTLLLIGRGKK